MMKRKLSIILALVLVSSLFSGCTVDKLQDEVSQKVKTLTESDEKESQNEEPKQHTAKTIRDYSSNEQDIITAVASIVDIIETKDVDAVANLFFKESQEECGYKACDRDEIQDFLNSYTTAEHVYAYVGSYEGGTERIDGVKYDIYVGVAAIIETTDNIYALQMSFDMPADKSHKGGLIDLRISSAKTEAYYNLDNDACDYFIPNESFYYADDFDANFDAEYPDGEYRIIQGDIVVYEDNDTILSEEEAKTFAEGGHTYEDMLDTFGAYVARYNGAYDQCYYKTENDSEYVVMCIDYDNSIYYAYVAEAIGQNWIDTKTITNYENIWN